MEPAAGVDQPKVAVAEAHEMAATLVLDEAHGLAGQCLADEDVFAAPLDRAVGAHPPDLMVGVVPRFGDACWHCAPWLQRSIEFSCYRPELLNK
jgi:hypothetical protein